MTEPQIPWASDRVDWLKIASATPDEKGKLPGHSRLAEMASEQFGVEVTRHQIRHAIRRFIEGGEEPVKTDAGDGKPPEVALLLRRLDALQTAFEKEKDKNAVVAEAVRSTVTSLPPLAPLPMPRGGSDDPHVAMLDLGDVHVGELVDPALTGGLSEYSFAIFKERGERLRRGVHSIVGIHRKAYPVDSLVVNLIGDIVSGERVYKSQAFQLDMPLLRQVFEGAYFLGNMFRDFARAFKTVSIRAVGGNHGADKDGHPRTNWDLAIYELLQILLRDHPNVDFEMATTSWLAYRIPGHERFNHIITHGEVRSWGSIPWYGFEREGAGLQSMLGMRFNYLHAGHVHNRAEWDSNRLEIMVNGSWVGGSDLSVNRMRRLAAPSQNLMFCHERRGVAAMYRVRLDEWAELQADDRGIFRTAAGAAARE